MFNNSVLDLIGTRTTDLKRDLGPADHLAIRYTIVTAIYAVSLAIFGGWRIERQDWPRLLVISLIGMMGYNLGSAFGFAHISAGIGSSFWTYAVARAVSAALS